MNPPDLNDLHYFALVVEHGGFAPAGRALGVPKSKLSRRIALLEERLGTRLILRSTRSFAVTEAGKGYYTHCRAMLVQAQAAEDFITEAHAEPRGVVRMACPVALLATRVGEMLADFMAAHPLVELHLEETNRRVDVVAEGLDLAIRVRPPPLQDSDLIMRVLSDRGQCLVASPSLLARCGTVPAGPADLAALPSMDLGQPQDEHSWVLEGPDGARAQVRHQPRYVTRAMLALRAAAVAGVGVVQLPRMMVAGEFERGELVPVLPGWAPRREIIHAVFASRRGQLPAVRQLIDYLVERFAQLNED
ncbi:LysR family transcriptional regulator [Acidovorax sp. FJL06]|uniref:LysR family transcriptional regulator n=1 Tax=Acidovorax sp. FJL06 TaxID=2153365 RepID=UPI000F582B11|nr:LysR family transcriptional regulator [Acidovorax sp. FJL06]RQO80256.1 LysR family transcriptional regulator [Acidovorax sp. FJL06]